MVVEGPTLFGYFCMAWEFSFHFAGSLESPLAPSSEAYHPSSTYFHQECQWFFDPPPARQLILKISTAHKMSKSFKTFSIFLLSMHMQLSAQKLLFSLRRTEFQKSQKFYFERERPRCRCRGGGAKHLTFQLQFCIQCKLCKRRKDFSPSLFKENFIFLIYYINDLV